jgi:hypothetical protein
MAGMCIATDLRVYTLAPTPSGSNNSIAITMHLCNTSSNTIALADVAVRYWYSRDGATSGAQVVEIDHSPDGGVATVEVVTPATLEVTHAVVYSWPMANLAAGTCAVSQSRVHTASYANGYDITNDWSYLEDGGATAATNLKTGIYAGPDIVWGCDPAGLGPHCVGTSTGGAAGTGGAAAATGGAASATGGAANATGGAGGAGGV